MLAGVTEGKAIAAAMKSDWEATERLVKRLAIQPE